MSEFAELRSDAFDVLKRMLDELSEKQQFGQYDAATLERIAKTCILLENQASKTGKGDGLKDFSNEDLAAAYDEAD